MTLPNVNNNIGFENQTEDQSDNREIVSNLQVSTDLENIILIQFIFLFLNVIILCTYLYFNSMSKLFLMRDLI